jgi:hypothetical protein
MFSQCQSHRFHEERIQGNRNLVCSLPNWLNLPVESYQSVKSTSVTDVTGIVLSLLWRNL